MLRRRLIVALVLLVGFAGSSVLGQRSGSKAPPAPAAPVIVLETAKGTIEIETFPSEAPKSVEHVLGLAKSNFYRGLRFHWVQPGVIQVGDPASRDMTRQDAWGKGGSGQPVGVAEPSKRPFVRGSVGLAYRPEQRPVAADSQIFILRIPNPNLNNKYAMIGHVIKGMEVADKIEQTDLIKSVSVK